MASSTQQITEDVLLLSFPWRPFGIDFKRNVTVLRLSDGRLVIHSTAPFTTNDIEDIRRFGEPSWLVEATPMHDTFAKKGRPAFPNLPYLAPDGFNKAIPTEPLDPPPSEWKGEIDVLKIDEDKTREHLFFHRRSRTLVVADLFFSFPEDTRGWPRFFARHVMRLPRLFGISLFFRLLMMGDREAFGRSMQAMLEWDFDRLIVGHWKTIETDAKRVVQEAVAEYCGANGKKSDK